MARGLFHWAAVSVLGLFVIGCSEYRTVDIHDVQVVMTEDGRVVRVVGKGFTAYQEVIERSPNVKSVTRMTDLKGDREPNEFSISPDGQSLVYAAMELKSRPYYWNLYRVSTSGSAGVTNVTNGRYYDLQPTFDPTGQFVFFASNRSSPLLKVCRVALTGAGGITRITQSDSDDRWPDVTPDGKEIYYSSRPMNAMDMQIWRATIVGNLPTQLREGWRPRLSPDGSKVLYCAKDLKSELSKLWVMGVDGTNQTEFIADPKADERDPAWSPDGTKIVFASNAGKDSNGWKNYDIWIMNADGSSITQLTTNGSADLAPEFSPDGKHIYFLSNRGFFWDIWRMEIAADTAPAASPQA